MHFILNLPRLLDVAANGICVSNVQLVGATIVSVKWTLTLTEH